MYIVRHDYTISFLEAKHQQQRINKLGISVKPFVILLKICKFTYQHTRSAIF